MVDSRAAGIHVEVAESASGNESRIGSAHTEAIGKIINNASRVGSFHVEVVALQPTFELTAYTVQYTE